MASDPDALAVIAARAAEMIPDGAVVGLGSGRAAVAFLHVLGERVAGGLRVRGVPTSRASDELARSLGIPVVGFGDVDAIDVDVDGADEVDPRLDCVKGYGGALVREKIVAAAATRVIVLVGEEKLVPVLGSRGKLPVEVLPFAAPFVQRRVREMFAVPADLRADDGEPFVTDNGNHVLDLRVGPLADPAGFDALLRSIPGVVGTGLFLGMVHTVLVQHGDTVRVLERGGGTGV
ncbi:MAG: ribose-5-phosphate isomerase RpiA [Fimbriiglobus sp.]